MIQRMILAVSCIMVLVSCAKGARRDEREKPEHVVLTSADIKWGPGPGSLPPGSGMPSASLSSPPATAMLSTPFDGTKPSIQSGEKLNAVKIGVPESSTNNSVFRKPAPSGTWTSTVNATPGARPW